MAVQIGICDDEEVQLNYLTGLVESWALEANVRISVSTYPSAESFFFDWSENKTFDILLLDIQMKEMDGMELARRIRERDDALQIVFVTGIPDYIAEGYDVRALHYLIKPVTPQKLHKVLSKALLLMEKRRPSVLIEAEDTTLRLYLSDILYLEARGRNMELHTKDRIYLCHSGITALEDKLAKASADFPVFFRTHRSFLVNLGLLNRIDHTAVILEDGTELPLSRRLYQDACRAMINYMKNG